MKKIAGFGAFVRDTWTIWVVGFALIGWLLLNLYAPPTVVLDSKHWECTMAKPEGLGAKCLEYVYKGAMR